MKRTLIANLHYLINFETAKRFLRQNKILFLVKADGGLRRSGAGVLNRARAKTLKMTVVIVLAFIFCWTPYYIIVIW